MTGQLILFPFRTVLIIILMAIKRRMHMTQRSLVTSYRGLLSLSCYSSFELIPIPAVVLGAIETIKGNPKFKFNIKFISTATLCLLSLLVAYFKFFELFVAIKNKSEQMHGHKSFLDGRRTWRGLFYSCFLLFVISTELYVSSRSDGSLQVSVALEVTMLVLFLYSSINPGLH